jgi:hypothetical protein
LPDGTFPSPPLRTGHATFAASGSPGTGLSGRLRLSASRILAFLLAGRLSPFALSRAFPASLVGRDSHDYYGDCVALGLVPRRRSRGAFLLSVIARCRWSVRYLLWPLWPTLPPARLQRYSTFIPAQDGIGLQAIYRWANRTPSGNWTSGSLAFIMSRGSGWRRVLHRFGAPALVRPC